MAETTMRTSGGDPVAVPEDRIAALEAAVRGTLVRPSDPAYDDARAVWNGMIDRRPALVVRCAGTADVMAAVAFAGEQGLLVAVRGGGHNVSGNAVCDGGLVIDVSPMRGVRVDPEGGTVRAQGPRHLRRQHGTARGAEAPVRPGQPLSPQPQRPARLMGDRMVGKATGSG